MEQINGDNLPSRDSASLHESAKALFMPRPEYRAAEFTTREEAERFSLEVAANVFKNSAMRSCVAQSGEKFLAQLTVSREPVAGTPIRIPGTIILTQDLTVVGLEFCAYSDDCDSGHDCWWIEDISGQVLEKTLIPR